MASALPRNLGVGRNALHLKVQYHPRSRARRSIGYSVVEIRGRQPWRLLHQCGLDDFVSLATKGLEWRRRLRASPGTQGEKVLCRETSHGGKYCGGRDPFDGENLDGQVDRTKKHSLGRSQLIMEKTIPDRNHLRFVPSPGYELQR